MKMLFLIVFLLLILSLIMLQTVLVRPLGEVDWKLNDGLVLNLSLKQDYTIEFSNSNNTWKLECLTFSNACFPIDSTQPTAYRTTNDGVIQVYQLLNVEKESYFKVFHTYGDDFKISVHFGSVCQQPDTKDAEPDGFDDKCSCGMQNIILVILGIIFILFVGICIIKQMRGRATCGNYMPATCIDCTTRSSDDKEREILLSSNSQSLQDAVPTKESSQHCTNRLQQLIKLVDSATQTKDSCVAPSVIKEPSSKKEILADTNSRTELKQQTSTTTEANPVDLQGMENDANDEKQTCSYDLKKSPSLFEIQEDIYTMEAPQSSPGVRQISLSSVNVNTHPGLKCLYAIDLGYALVFEANQNYAGVRNIVTPIGLPPLHSSNSEMFGRECLVSSPLHIKHISSLRSMTSLDTNIFNMLVENRKILLSLMEPTSDIQIRLGLSSSVNVSANTQKLNEQPEPSGTSKQCTKIHEVALAAAEFCHDFSARLENYNTFTEELRLSNEKCSLLEKEVMSLRKQLTEKTNSVQYSDCVIEKMSS